MARRESDIYTPAGICHRLMSRLEHTCLNVDENVRHGEDYDHFVEEIDDIHDNIEDIREDMCITECFDMPCWNDLDATLHSILAHVDRLHRDFLGHQREHQKVNPLLKATRENIKRIYHAHLDKYPTHYGHWDLKLGQDSPVVSGY